MTLPQDNPQERSPPDVLVILLPLLVVLSTLLFLLLLFLISILLIRRRRGISLRDNDGPVDLSREDLIEGEGGFEGVESRWLESVAEPVRREYLRAKEYQLQYPPNSFPTDITLSQFLSIQEKGVSAWSFEPDVETINSLLVHARTEITFLPDPASASCVQSNLPLPKLNEVYYWEVKMFDLPTTTNVAVGLATKPYPLFRLPGHSRFSMAYHTNGDKSYNYPFTSTTFGPQLKEGDVLGVGYRPRTGTVFFTRNGRKLDDAFTGLSRWNLFPTIGADGPCSVHVNLGQAGFVFIEANVKKWGLAPSIGTLAPPPAYGSERGSILLDVGRGDGRSPVGSPGASSPPLVSPHRRHSHRSRRPKPNANNAPVASSPLRPTSPGTPPPPITPISEETVPILDQVPPQPTYISPTDTPIVPGRASRLPSSLSEASPQASPQPEAGSSSRPSSPPLSAASSSRSASPEGGPGASDSFNTPRRRNQSLTHAAVSLSLPRSDIESSTQVHPPPDSPYDLNPPTPNQRDIHLQALPSFGHRRMNSSGSTGSASRAVTEEDIPIENLPSAVGLSRREPPAYSPLDAYTYADGVHVDLPADVITAALEGQPTPHSAVGQRQTSQRRRSHRR